MKFFAGINFGVSDRVPACSVWIDRVFDCYALNYAHTGRVQWQMTDGSQIWLEAPVLFWTWPGQRFVYGSPPRSSEIWDQSYVTYNGALARRMARQGLAPIRSTCWSAVVEPSRVRRSFDDLLETLHRPMPDVDLAVHLLQGLFLQTRTTAGESANISLAGQIVVLRDEMGARPGQPWLADHQADQLGISLVHFRRLFLQLAGTPFHQFVILARMQLAAGLLRRTQLPVKQVALRCGYGDISHFYKAFVARHGVAPATYQRNAAVLSGRAKPDKPA